jgi:hypothetical protein
MYEFRLNGIVQNEYFSKSISLFLVLIAFLTAYLIYRTNELVWSLDSVYVIPTSLSIINEHDIELGEYSQLFVRPRDYRITEVDGNYYNYFPIGTSILILPFVGGIEIYRSYKATERGKPGISFIIVEKWISAIIAALCAAVIFMIARQCLGILLSYCVFLIFTLGSPLWSVGSSALWQHGPTMLMLSSSIYLILLAEKNEKMSQFVSIPLAFSYLIRPTNSISIIVLSLFVFYKYRKYFIRYLLWALPIAGFFVAINLNIYGTILPPYYNPERIFNFTHFFSALAGNLISPSRGLLVYSPILILAVISNLLRIKNGEMKSLDWMAVVIILAHWLIVSTFSHWWGGVSYGPRFMSDMIPYFILPTIYLISYLSDQPKVKKILGISLMVTLIAVSTIIQYRGVNELSTYQWNRSPVRVDQKPSRVWDFSDPQFMR